MITIRTKAKAGLLDARSDRGVASRSAAAWLAVMLALSPAADVVAQPMTQQASSSAPVTGDGDLHFWAVNEGGARIYRPDAPACSRIRGLSAQYADAISSKYRVPAYTLKIVEVRPPHGSAACRLLIDTSAGMRECRLGSVIKTFGGSFLAHTYAQDADGSVRYVAGDCQ